MMVEMFVTSLTLDPVTKTPFIIMKDRENKYSFPIWIGIFEASAIAFELEGIKPQRPMTHDLISSILIKTGIKIKKVEIGDVQENTYFASVHLVDLKGGEYTVDARPSDGIALALRLKAPIMISEDVILKARRMEIGQVKDDSYVEKEKWSEVLENLAPEAFGKYKM